MSPSPAIETHDLGKRYGAHWALRDCSLVVPAGSVSALVGPNGAGKTTLLHLAVGLTAPSTGSVHVLGRSAREQPELVLPRVGFVAQDHPLYRGFTIAETLVLGRKLNPRWHDAVARERLARSGIPLEQRIGSLSGGQQAQVALTLALAKRPDVLLLDEPVASLDPLARREFMQSLMEAVADGDLTVLLSSHVIAELERVCDHLVILAAGGVQLAGSIDGILDSHRLLIGPRADTTRLARANAIIEQTHSERQTTLLVRRPAPVYGEGWQVSEAGLEEIVLGYLGQPSARPRGPERVRAGVPS
jgi:ABC-2 type transport system ATP-binding protein